MPRYKVEVIQRNLIKEYARLVDRYHHDSDGTIEALVV